MRIAILSDWGTGSPFFEQAVNVVEQLTKAGHETSIIAPVLDDSQVTLDVYRDGDRVFRFDAETTAEQILAKLEEWRASALFVNAECELNKPRLNHVVKAFTGRANRTYLFIHSEQFDKQIEYGQYSALLYPNRVFQKLPPGRIRVSYIEQGIPEFGPFPDRTDFRHKTNLPPVDQPVGDKDDLNPSAYGYLLITFARPGKTNITNTMKALDYINKNNLVGRPVHLFAQAANPMDAVELDAKVESEYLIPSAGYLTSDALANYFHAADGAIFIYPESKVRYTSSAIRFAAGCDVPIVTNKGLHASDIDDLISVYASNESVESIKHAIVTLLTNHGVKRGAAARLQSTARAKKGWTAVGKQLSELLSNHSTNILQKA